MDFGLVVLVCLAGPVLLVLGLVRVFTSPREGPVRGGALVLAGGLISALIGGLFVWLNQLNFTKGRLLRIGGRARLAQREEGDGWAEPLSPRVEDLSIWERQVLGELWLQAARMEHASVPAFSQLTMRLARHGAPADLIERSLRAALDEVRHARLCFGLATGFSGRRWTAGPLPALDGLRRPPRPRTSDQEGLARLAVSSLFDGCLGEQVAALAAERAGREAEDPVVRGVLAEIARDEYAHAAVAWDVIDWCLGKGGEPVRRALTEAIARLPSRKAPALPPIPGMSDSRLEAHGLLSQAKLAQVFDEVVGALEAAALRLLERDRDARRKWAEADSTRGVSSDTDVLLS